MKKAISIFCAAAMLIMSVNAAVTEESVSGYETVKSMSDEFDKGSISEWSWVNDALKSYNLKDGEIEINSYVPGANSSENILVTNAGVAGDFISIIKFKPNALTADSQEAGIYIWNNWNEKQNFAAVGKGNGYMIINHDGNSESWPQAVTDADGSIWFKVERKGDYATFSYSGNGKDYTKKFTKQITWNTVKIGIYACYTERGAGLYPTSADDERNFTASFDYVKTYTPIQTQIDGFGYDAERSDEFDGDASKWNPVNANLCNYSVGSGSMNINAYVPGANSSENMFYGKTAVNEDFIYVCKIKPNIGSANSQQAGIMIWQDWNSKQQFFCESKGSNYIIVHNTENDSGYPQIVPSGDGYVYFKVKRIGNDYTFSYSSDGVNYTDKYTRTLNYENVKVGFFACFADMGNYPSGETDENNFIANVEYARVFTKSAAKNVISITTENDEGVAAAKLNIQAAQNVDGLLIAAAYKDGKLEAIEKTDVSIKAGEADEFICELYGVPGCTVKAFFVNDLETFMPIK